MPDAIVTTHPDKDGVTVTESRLRKQKTSVTTSETVTGGLWKKVQYVEPDTGLVGWELTTTRSVTGVAIVSTRLDPDGTVITREETFSELSAITASEVLVGSNVVKTFAEAISDLVGWKVVETKPVFANKSSTTEINDPVPDEFKGVIPSYETETTVPGAIVDPPVLSAGDLKKTEEQISTLLKRVILLTRAGISFPVVFTNKEVTSQFGGGTLDIILTLDDSLLTVDTGYRVVRSKVIVTGGGSLWLKETAQLPSGDWPSLTERDVDPSTGIIVDSVRKVVDPTTYTPSGAYEELRAIDRWKTTSIAPTLNTDSLPDPISWETTIEHAFPNTLVAATFVWASASNSNNADFDAALLLNMKQGYSGPCRAKITESFSVGAPSDTVTITEFFPQAHMVGFTWWFASDAVARASARTFGIPPSLHDAIDLNLGFVLGGTPRTVTDGVTASDDRTVGSATGAFSDSDIGASVVGSGIPVGAIITSIDSSTAVELSLAATATGTGVSLTITPSAASSVLPATNPAELPAAGTLITKDVHVERWRLGVFLRRVTEIYVPNG